jgi:peptidoglycan/xylan/chitin deacetylase (PgdA/CDA1 family)
MAPVLKVLALSLLYQILVVRKVVGDRVFLTFDDGPHPEYTPRLLDALSAHGATATFFVQGQHVVRYPDVARRIVEDGHTIAGHSWSHRRLSQWAFRDAWVEFDRTRQAIRDVVGVDTIMCRPPFGHVTIPMLTYAAVGRMKLVLWSVDSNDHRSSSVETVLANGRRLQSGDIFLCHDDSETNLEAIPTLLHEWRERGLEPCALPSDYQPVRGSSEESADNRRK